MTGRTAGPYTAAMNPRWPSILLALSAAAAFALSVHGGRWWVIDTAELGPFGARVCPSDTCMSGGLASVAGGAQWARFGIATWGAGVISVLVLLLLAAGVAARRVPRLAARTLVVAIATAAVAGGVFFAKFPSDELPAATVGRGPWLFALAIVLAAAAAALVLRAPPARPADADAAASPRR